MRQHLHLDQEQEQEQKLGLELTALASWVRAAALQEELVTTLTLEAPEEFLDPIMSTLPSFDKVVDRTTIAKHLHTDQSDPFYRQPIIMPRGTQTEDQEVDRHKSENRAQEN